MTDAEPVPVPVEVVRWVEGPGVDDGPTGPDGTGPDGMGPASPRHAYRGPSVWRRTVVAGQEALAGSSEAIAVQVDAVAERMLAALERRADDRLAHRAELGLPAPAWQVDQVEVSFGVQLTGEATVAVFSGSVQTSAQIVLTFTRAAEPAQPGRP
jgi:hypothetical protein